MISTAWRVRWSLLLALLFLVLIVSGGLFWLQGLTWALLSQLTAVALLVATAVQLYRDLRHEWNQRQTLLTISEGLLSRSEISDLLDEIVRAASALVPSADRCVIHLLDETGRRLYPRYASKPEAIRSLGIPADKGIAGLALQTLRTQVVADVSQEPHFLPLHSGENLRALLVAPLHARGRPLGTISLNNSVPGKFSKQDEILLTMLAAQASVAIHQAQLYAKAVQETHHVEAIFNSLTAGLVLLDAKDCVLRYNASLAHILGVHESEIIGHKLDQHSDHEGLRRLASLLPNGHAGEQHPLERQLVLEEPVHAVLRVHISPVLDPDGTWGRIIVLYDQTEERDLIESTAGLLRAAAAELRSSLESIRGYATLLLSHNQLDPQAKRYAHSLREQVAPLLCLVRDLADLSLETPNILNIKREMIEFNTLIAAVIEETAFTAQQRGVSIHVQCPPDLPPLPLDGDRIHHVLLYILRNALHRARPGGTIEIKVEANLAELTLTIADDGQPIPDAIRTHAFAGSYRIHTETDDHAIGIDLGLYLSRKILDAHGGHLWMPNNGARGAKFQFILPLD